MIHKTYLSILAVAVISLTSCEQVNSQVDTDLTKMNLPEGTEQVVEKTMIYKYKTDEIKPRSTSTFTFNKDGNFLTHVETFPNGTKNTQEYSYDSQGRLSAITAYASRTDNTSITRYTYEGVNPQTILINVENGPTYIPKIVNTYDGEKVIKKEVYNNDGVLREQEVTNGNEMMVQSFTNSGNPSFKKVIYSKDGNEVKKVNYGEDGKIRSGVENEFDKHGNMTQSWMLDANLNRDKKSFGYYYTYDNDAWVLRIGKEIRDYGSGAVANIKVREIKGATTASITETDIKKALKEIKI